MNNTKNCSETGCYVCATRNHFRLLYYLGCFPLRLECHPKKPLKPKEAFAVQYDKTGFIIAIVYHLIAIQFIIEGLFQTLNLPEDSPDVLIIMGYFQAGMHAVALMGLHWNLFQLPNTKLEIEGFSQICEAHSLLRPMFTTATQEKINYDTYVFVLVLLGIFGSSFTEIGYKLLYNFNVTIGEVYFAIDQTFSLAVIGTKVQMFFMGLNFYGYLLEEHHDYLKL